ncbi:MAG: hypothetical protein ACOYNI_01270 [Acidimicrobiia bacterium]
MAADVAKRETNATAPTTARRGRTNRERAPRPPGRIYAIALVASCTLVLVVVVLANQRSEDSRSRATEPVNVTLPTGQFSGGTTAPSTTAPTGPTPAVIDSLAAVGLEATKAPRVYVEGDLDFADMPTADAAGNGVDFAVPANWYLAADAAKRGLEVYGSTDKSLADSARALLNDRLLSTWTRTLDENVPIARSRATTLVLAEPFAERGTRSVWSGRIVLEPVDGSRTTTYVVTGVIERQNGTYRLVQASYDPI